MPLRMQSASNGSRCRPARSGFGRPAAQRGRRSRPNRGTGTMYQTTYVRAVSLTEAANLLRDNPEAKLISGGQTLVPTLRQRLARPTHIVDIAHLTELRGLSQEGDRVVIGATTTHAEVAASDLVRQTIPGLAYLAGLIGDPPVRHLGTIGGSIANSDPAADYPAAVLALNATVQTSKRTIAADDFFTGLFETALDPGE